MVGGFKRDQPTGLGGQPLLQAPSPDLQTLLYTTSCVSLNKQLIDVINSKIA